MIESLKTELVSSKHGFDDFDVRGLYKVHRVCVKHDIRRGDYFNVYADNGVKLGAEWMGNLPVSMERFVISNNFYQGLVAAA